MAAAHKTELLAQHINRLRTGYLQKLDGELERVAELVRQSDGDKGTESVAEIQMILHRLAGSAGTFGLTELGARARLLELKVANGVPDDLPAFLVSIGKLRDFSQAQAIVGSARPAHPEVALPEITADVRDVAVLIVSDDPEYCQLLASVLEGSFKIAQVHSGAAALFYYRDADADIILLDVGLPDMSGYDVCWQLDAVRPRDWRSVVFMSAHNRLEDKLAAYDAGGDDYFSKPIHLAEFVARLRTLATYTQSKKDLLSQNQFARKLAHDSMAEMSQYGRLLDFMRGAMNCRDHKALVAVFFETMDNCGLKASLRLSDAPMRCFAAPEQACSPIETDLFKVLVHAGRLHHMGRRTMVNGRYTGFLVKNMPVDDAVAYGRVKDLLGVMVEALDASYLGIARQQVLASGVAELGALARRIAHGIVGEDAPVKMSARRLENLMRQLENSVNLLDLDEEQKKILFGLLHQGAEDATRVLEALAGLGEELTDINLNLLRYNI